MISADFATIYRDAMIHSRVDWSIELIVSRKTNKDDSNSRNVTMYCTFMYSFGSNGATNPDRVEKYGHSETQTRNLNRDINVAQRPRDQFAQMKTRGFVDFPHDDE